MYIKSASGLRDFAQGFVIQLRFDDLARRILYKRSLAIFAGNGNQRTLRCSDADCENSYTRVSRLFYRFYSVAALLGIAAIGEDDERPVPSGAFAKALRGKRYGAGDVGPAFGNRLRVQIIQRLNDSIVINRKWRLQKSAARKSNQANAVALQFIDQILDRQLDALQPVWLDVIGKHAARCVHCDQQIEPFALYVLERIAPARLRETDNGQGKPE